MALYEITADSFKRIEQTRFEISGLSERGDLQRLLRKQIEIILPEVLVIAEEFGDWDESRRRIDLLAVDCEGNLVVIELKRNEDGGHMELQSLRYAAMVSGMTFDQAVLIYQKYLGGDIDNGDAREALLRHLGLEEPDESRFARAVRIVLVASNFSKEITTTVMWLNERGLDIRCIRIAPYADNGRVLVDVQQLIPLPEAADYQIRVQTKERRIENERIERPELARARFDFWSEYVEALEGESERGGDPQYTSNRWRVLEGLEFVVSLMLASGKVGLFVRAAKGVPDARARMLLEEREIQLTEALGVPLGASDRHFLYKGRPADFTDPRQRDELIRWFDAEARRYEQALRSIFAAGG
jgi:hypothetical protein